MSAAEKTLEIKYFMVFFENALAVNNVNLDCEKRKITGAFGSNSAGKSTLMWSISGIIMDMKKKEEMKGGERISWFGDINFQGESILGLSPDKRAKKGIILCPERRLIFGESSVIENLRIGAYLATRIEEKKTLEYVFNLFPELIKLKRKPGGFLSGGEQQMLSIGRALMAQPRLLLLDEPLLGLAPSIEIRLCKAIKDINMQLGITVLITEQYARPLLPIVENCYVMENGAIVFSGDRECFKRNPEVMNSYFGGL